MVNYEFPVEFEIFIANEAVILRPAIDHHRIFEPAKMVLLPRRLEIDVRNGKPGYLRSHDEIDFESGAGTPVERRAFDDPARLTHQQGVGRNAADVAVILANVDGTPGAPNSTRIGQLIKSFIFHR